MHMIRHHQVSHQVKPVALADFSEGLHEEIAGSHGAQQRQPPVTTEGEKMQVALPVEAFQALRLEKPPRVNPTRGAPPLATLCGIVKVLSSLRNMRKNQRNPMPGPPSGMEKPYLMDAPPAIRGGAT